MSHSAEELDRYQSYGKRIEDLIRPATFPLAVRLVQTEAEIEAGFKRPSRDLGLQNFVCQNFKMARTYGWTMAVTEADTNCKLARGVYGWDAPSEEERKWGEAFSTGLYAKDGETASRFEPTLYKLDRDFSGLVISPLTRTKVVPDTVLIYCLPAQAMRLVQAYLYVAGGALAFSAAGRVGSCHEGVTKAVKTGQPQYVTLGNGDRVWGGAQDNEVMFACPGGVLETLVQGLEATHRAGLRYPVPAYMNYAPGFQADFEKAAVERAGGTIEKN